MKKKTKHPNRWHLNWMLCLALIIMFLNINRQNYDFQRIFLPTGIEFLNKKTLIGLIRLLFAFMIYMYSGDIVMWNLWLPDTGRTTCLRPTKKSACVIKKITQSSQIYLVPTKFSYDKKNKFCKYSYVFNLSSKTSHKIFNAIW